MDSTLLWIGLGIGWLVGLTAAGGGALLTPLLVLGLGVPVPVAIGTDTLVAGVWRLAAGASYAADRAVDWRTVRRLAWGSVPGVLVGTQLVGLLSAAVTLRLLGAAVVLAGAVTARRLARRHPPAERPAPGRGATAAVGFVTGALVGATSIGGGTVLLAWLAVGVPLGAARLVGTDLAHGLVLAGVAVAAHGTAGRVDLALAAPLLAGGVPGAVLGARLATRLPERALRAGLAAVLLLLGFGLIGR